MATFDDLIASTQQKEGNTFDDLVSQTGARGGLSFDELLSGKQIEPDVPIDIVPPVAKGPSPEIVSALENVEDPSFFPEFATGGSFQAEDVKSKELDRQIAIEQQRQELKDKPPIPFRGVQKTEQVESFPDFATGNVFSNTVTGEIDLSVSDTAIEADPLVDPVSVVTAAGTAGSVMALRRALNAGKPMIESLLIAGGRGITASAVTAIGEFGIAAPTSLVEGNNPQAALLLNIGLGVVSGLTVENALERYVIKKFTGSSADELSTAISRGMEFLRGNGDLLAKTQDEIRELSPEKLDELLGIQDFGKENKEVAQLFGDIELSDIKSKLKPKLSGVSAEESAEAFIEGAPTVSRQEAEASFISRGYISDLDETFPADAIPVRDTSVVGVREGMIIRDLGDGFQGSVPITRKPTAPGGVGGVGIPKSTEPDEFDFFPKRTAEDFNDSPLEEVKRFFKTDTFEAAKARLTDFFSGNTLRSGIDPEALKDFVTVGGYHLESGIHDFTKWSAKMVDDFGPAIEPFLKQIYDSSIDTMVRASVKLEPTRVEREEIPVLANRMGTTPEEGEQLRKYAGSINLQRITGPDELKFAMQRVQDDNAAAFSKVTRGTITNVETARRAQTSGVSEKVLKKMLKKQGGGQILNAEDATALRMLHAKSTDDTLKLTARARETESVEDISQAMAAIERHRMIQAANSGVASEQGRALQARNILVSPEDIAARNFNKLLDKVGGKELALEKLLRLSQIDPTDVVAVNKFIREVADASTGDKIFEVWVNALLSAPTTHSVNVLSNALTFMSRFPEKGLSATADAVASALTGKPKSRFFGEVAAEAFGTVSGLRVGYNQMLRSFINEMSADSFTKLEMGGRVAIKGTKGKVVRIPGRFLTAADEFFKGLNYTTELHSIAFRQATQEGKVGKAKVLRMSEILADPSEEMAEVAFKSARDRTFQKALSPEMRKVSSLRSSTQGAWGAFKFVVPFVRTPWNIIKFAVERTPLPFLRVAKEMVQKIPVEAGDRADRIGKAAWGTILGSWAYSMAGEGNLTGAGPKEPARREALYNTGWMPYSVKVGDKYYSYGRLEPLGSILGMAADYYEGRNEMSDGEKNDFTVRMIRSFGTNVTSKTFLRGISDMMAAVNDPERHAQRWVDNFVGTAIPRIAANTARAKDRYLREANSTSDYVQSQVPLWSEQLYPRRNRWGNRVERQGTPAQRMFSPVVGSAIKGTEADREIVRLNANIQKVRKTWMGIELTPEQYDTLTFAAGDKAEGMVLKFINSEFKSLLSDDVPRETLEEIGSSKNYDKIDDFLKKDIIESIYSAGTGVTRRQLFRIDRDEKGKPIALEPTKLYNETRKRIAKLEKD